MMLKYVPLDEGMVVMEEAIAKAKKIVEGQPETRFTGEEYQRFYQCVYFMCTYRCSDEKTMQLYDRFKRSLEESIITVVLPSLACKNGAYLLTELVLMWSNYKLMAKWLCRFFGYLDRYFIPQKKELASLNDLSVNCFNDLVFKRFYCEFMTAAISLINQEREGLQIDWDLLKNVLHIFLEVDSDGEMKYYQNFEHVMLVETSKYYSRLTSEWLLYDSSADYIKKAFWCLTQEEKRGSQYLHPSTGVKLLQVVRFQLLDQPANKLIEKKQAENRGLVTDYQEILTKCAGMTLEGGSSISSPEEWLSALMAKSANIC